EAVMAGPESEIVGRPGLHRRAIAIGAAHPDLAGLGIVDMAARRPEIEPVALARVDHRAFLVEAEAFGPARILVDPRILDALGRDPVVAAPDVEHESAIFGCEARLGVRADHAALDAVADLDFVPGGRSAVAIGHQPGVAHGIDLGQLGRAPALH